MTKKEHSAAEKKRFNREFTIKLFHPTLMTSK